MNDIKLIITEQLQQLQMLMHRAAFQDYSGDSEIKAGNQPAGFILPAGYE